MVDQLVTLILDESKWLAASMSFAVLAVTLLLYPHRHTDLFAQRRVLAVMNLFFGVTIGTMALGHLLAVTTKLVLGTLEGSILASYAIGIALAAPSWWLIGNMWKVLASDSDHGRTTVGLNAWLAFTLLALGVHNLPLAAHALWWLSSMPACSLVRWFS